MNIKRILKNAMMVGLGTLIVLGTLGGIVSVVELVAKFSPILCIVSGFFLAIVFGGIIAWANDWLE